MKIISKGRRNGKTTELIRMCAERGGYIVCRSNNAALMIKRQSKEMGLKIPYPITYAELLHKNYYAKGVKKLYIDDANELLRTLTRGVEVEAITINIQEEREEGQSGNRFK